MYVRRERKERERGRAFVFVYSLIIDESEGVVWAA